MGVFTRNNYDQLIMDKVSAGKCWKKLQKYFRAHTQHFLTTDELMTLQGDHFWHVYDNGLVTINHDYILCYENNI